MASKLKNRVWTITCDTAQCSATSTFPAETYSPDKLEAAHWHHSQITGKFTCPAHNTSRQRRPATT